MASARKALASASCPRGIGLAWHGLIWRYSGMQQCVLGPPIAHSYTPFALVHNPRLFGVLLEEGA